MSAESEDPERAIRRVARVLSLAVVPFARFDLPPAAERPTDQPLIWAPNHRSIFDILVGLVCLQRIGVSASFLVNARYFERRWGGALLTKVGAIPVDLDNGGLAAIAAAARRLREGRSVVIMAEGRLVQHRERQRLGIGELSPGVVIIARRAEVPIIATAIVGSDDVWPIGRRFPRIRIGARSTVRVRLSRPIVVTGRPREALAELTTILSDLVLATEASTARAPLENG